MLRAMAMACSALVVLVACGTAEAATVTRVGATITYQSQSGERDAVHVFRGVSTYDFTAVGGPLGPPAPIVTGVGCDPQPLPLGGATCAFADVTLIEVDLLDGDDTALMWNSLVPVDIAGDLGDDALDGGLTGDRIAGGPGNDRLNGLDGADMLQGGLGDDELSSGNGPGDVIVGDRGDDRIQGLFVGQDASGGPGTDQLLDAGNEDITVSLDDLANDGVGTAMGANIRSDVENVATAGGDDILTGSSAPNRLESAGGADRLVGGPGVDVLIAGSGDDIVNARDGEGDGVDCGPGQDIADADRRDTIAGCEIVRFDEDRDGASHEDDCNDNDATVFPGAFDVPDDGVDQDCQGGDRVNRDRDGDGFERPADCDDGSRRVHPGAREVPGNRRDENCDGVAAPYARITSVVRTRWSTGRRTSVVVLTVRDAPSGALVVVRCRGGGCPKRVKRVRSAGGKEIRLARHFAGRKLRPGTRIEVRITSKRAIGKLVRYRIRRGKALPAVTVLCLPPGAARPSRCRPERAR